MMMKKGRREVDAPELDMTPMIDCVFQLIIFFMLIMSIKSVYGIAIKFPLASNSPPSQAKRQDQVKPVVVWVGPDRYGPGHKVLSEGYVKINGEPVGLGTDKNPDKAKAQHEKGMKFIRQQLAYFRNSKDVKYDSLLTVTGEVNSYHGKIVEVVDQGKRAGLKGFNLVPPQVR